MRKLVLSVCVGLLVCACDGAVDKSQDEAEIGDGGANSSDSTVEGERGDDAGDVFQPTLSDGAASSPADGGSPTTLRDGSVADGGSRDAGSGDTGARDAGRDASGGQADAAQGNPDAGGATGRPVFVIGGYRHGIAMSTDLGRTWRVVNGLTPAPAEDDQFVLSGAAFGKGTFVVAGVHIFTSKDGQSWTQRTGAENGWLGSLNFGNGVFAGAGGNGFSQWSEDGIAWHKGTNLGDEHSDTSAFGNGAFMATSRSGRWWRSTDGKDWKPDSTEHTDRIVWCRDHFADARECTGTVTTGQVAYGEGVWIRVQNDTILQRSTNGQQWSDVSVTFDANCVAFGYVP